MTPAPAPDGRHDDLDEADLAGLALLVPDDPSSLSADIAAYRRELKERTRGGLGSHPVLLRLTPFAVAAVIVSLTLASMVSALSPRAVGVLAAKPLASTSAAVGQVGGLLPDVTVPGTGNGALRQLRPGVVLLVPASCDSACAQTASVVWSQMSETGLRLLLVTVGGTLTQPVTLDVGSTVPDPHGALAAAYAPQGVTAVLVAADGTVTDVLRGLTPASSLLAPLAALTSG